MATKVKNRMTGRVAPSDAERALEAKNGDVDQDTSTEINLEKEALMNFQPMRFRIIGLSPLLQNNPANFIGKQDEDDLIGKKKYDDEEEAWLRVYIDGQGYYYHPGESFVRSISKAVAGKKFGKVFATKLVDQAVNVGIPYCWILDEDGEPMKTKMDDDGKPLPPKPNAKPYGIDRRSVVIGKSRVLRCRPCWDKWSINLELSVDANILHYNQVLLCLKLAGRYPGVGDFRPEKKGAFGRFTVEAVE